MLFHIRVGRKSYASNMPTRYRTVETVDSKMGFMLKEHNRNSYAGEDIIMSDEEGVETNSIVFL